MPPCGGHRGSIDSANAKAEFQVVPPCGGHRSRSCCRCCRPCCFKSCPRVGGIGFGQAVLAGGFVSSRAPVWGASSQYGCILLKQKVSSRAPVWGASCLPAGWESLLVFQVVPPCGGHQGDRRMRKLKCEFQVVPPCGGHRQGWPGIPAVHGFKSCPRVGGIVEFLEGTTAAGKFQVVPPCGGHPDQSGGCAR